MRLHVLGSGSCIVQQERVSSGYLLEVGDQLLMIDTGTSTTRNLRKTGFSTADLDAIMNTHRHPDHVSDLVPIIQDKVVRSFQQDEPDISVFGPPGHEKYLERRMQDEMRVNPGKVSDEFGFNLDVRELGDAEIDGINFRMAEVKHGPENFNCVSIAIADGETEIVFTGDTGYFEELSDFVEGAEVLVADCSKPDGEKLEGHMTPSECARVADKSNVDTLILSHLYPEAEEADLVRSAEKIFEGRIIVAEDLQKIDF